MNDNYEFLLKDISNVKNVGKKTALLFKKKNINNIFDILWRLPQSYTDRSNICKIKHFLTTGYYCRLKKHPSSKLK